MRAIVAPIHKIVLCGVLMAAGACVASIGVARVAAAHIWPGERFGQCTDDPRIFCEPGSEPFARVISTLLSAAVAQVERKQYGAFSKPIKIYIYSSLDTYALYSGTRAGAGVTSFGEVHLAPLMQSFPKQYAALLAHELAHLHLVQYVGAFDMVRLPSWFTEGWATLTSDGGGAARVQPEQAIFALVHGRHFTPLDTGSLPFSPSARDFKPGDAMHYRQASLFVEYLQGRDPNAFAALTGGLKDGEGFGPALLQAYGQPLPVLWQDFQASLRRHQAARWEHE
jgi:hypothetical protein